MTDIKTPSPWFLYMIETKHGQIYTGISLDWKRRIEEHHQQGTKCAKALRGKAPLNLRFCIELPERRSAMQAEIWIKKQSKSRKLHIISKEFTIPFPHKMIDSAFS